MILTRTSGSCGKRYGLNNNLDVPNSSLIRGLHIKITGDLTYLEEPGESADPYGLCKLIDAVASANGDPQCIID